MSYLDEYNFAQVRGNIGFWPVPPEDPTPAEQYLDPLLTHFEHTGFNPHLYDINVEALDPLIPDLKSFWVNVQTWATTGWDDFALWLSRINHWFFRIAEELRIWLDSISGTIKDEVSGLANFISNIYTWVVWNLVDDITTFVTNLFKPLTDAWYYGVELINDFYREISNAISDLLETPFEWMSTAISDLWTWLGDIANSIWSSMTDLGVTIGDYMGAKLTAFAPVVIEFLRDVLIYVWDAIKAGFLFVADDLMPAAWESTKGALGWLKDEFTNIVGLAYDDIIERAGAVVPITPGRSAAVAAGMFGSAVGFGTLSHSMALAVEAIPNLKYMGVHYLSSFVARMGSFGTISSATMGVIAALAIKEPFTYYINALVRSRIPDDKLLIEFRSKREIDFDQFKSYMKYQGYTDDWIAKIDSWLWKDPRLFEILYCADVTVPPKEWLIRKFERAGYEDIDIATLVKVVERRTTRSPRTYYTTSLRRNFRHGFLSEEALVEGIRALEMAEDAIDWIKRTGELDNIYEVNQDWVTTFKTAYRNDILTEEEMRAQLAAIGLPADRVDGIAELEYVRKQPKILRDERNEIATQWREIQSSSSRVYLESFRRGLINESTLTSFLIAIGIHEKAAKMTARHEAIKLVPKSKPEAITIPRIPEPPRPPVYED